MKVAAALRDRSGAGARIQNLQGKVLNCLVLPVGVQPDRNPDDLLHQIARHFDAQADLVVQINRTNNDTFLVNNMSLMEAIVRRDMLTQKVTQLTTVLSTAQRTLAQERRNIVNGGAQPVLTIDLVAWESRVEAWAEEARLLNEEIQDLNGKTELIQPE